MNGIDMHCDTLMAAHTLNLSDMSKANIYQLPSCSVDLERLHQGGMMAQFFAIFLLPPGAEKYLKLSAPIPDEEYIANCVQILRQSVDAHRDIVAMAGSAGEIRENWKQGKVSAVLTMEDGRAVDGKLENIKRFFDMGVRAMSLTWNAPNCFGYPNSSDPAAMAKGLTDFGKEAVAYMQELGMLVDVSHLSDGGFYDVAQICQKPFVATHSNSRALSPHQRNLTDDMLRVLGDKGGVAGINFGPEFLNADITAKRSTAALIAAHARHMADVGGIDCVALGTDFDGIQGDLEVDSPLKMTILEGALKAEGFTSREIDKIAHENVLRVLEAAMA